METTLITGGAGFIGSNFVHYYRKAFPQRRIINLDALTYAGNLENLKGISEGGMYRFVRADIGDKEFISNLFKEEKISKVVNFAAESHVDRSITGPEIFIQSNVLGTFNLLENAKRAWEDDFCGKRFLHVSTDEVYGSLGSEGKFSETTPYAPNSPYAASKAASDHFVRAYHHTYGMPVITTNCSNNYGPYQFPEKLIPLMILNIIKQKKLPVYGKGLNVRDWLYVEDHCKGIVLVLEKGKPGETYNIGGNNEWKNIDIVHLLCERMDERLSRSGGNSAKKFIHYVDDRPGHDARYAIDASKISKELGWHPEETFETGIQKTVDWYVSNPGWVEKVVSHEYQSYYDRMYKNR